MTLLLRRSRVQARIEGWANANRPDDDYAIVDNADVVGRIYREIIIRENRSGGGSSTRFRKPVRGGRLRRQIREWPRPWLTSRF
jgi:hypothetical protein